ncbi:alkaline phosphatase family protein [Marinobacter lacisalsi]|uniref:Alkaline phosphatase family protein n=1 Tax=Marinobacter lacisalsi TaxID=475979 RepID=A0ABV8QNH3_9GAMM
MTTRRTGPERDLPGLSSNGEIGSKTLLVVTFDRNGGLFDHGPPPYVRIPGTLWQEPFRKRLLETPSLFMQCVIEKSWLAG